METKSIVKSIVEALEDKKGEDIKVIDITKVSVIADYFIIVSAKNDNQIKALSDEVLDRLGRQGIEPRQIEGANSKSWILIDYHDVIVHIFNESDRLFYDIERIWSDGKLIKAAEL